MFGKKIIAGVLIAGVTSLWATVGIAGSPHDLSGITWAGGTVANDDQDNGELCVYCHTPHAANTAFAGAPLWNKDSTLATANNAFILYGATAAGNVGSTIAGTVVGNTGGVVNAPSMACLSCHDGVSAVNSVVNAPGAGLSAGGNGLINDAAVTILDTWASANAVANLGAGTGTADLSNDHPISVEYLGDGSANSPASLRATSYSLTGWSGATTIGALLRTTGTTEYVECGSCHDPHNGVDTFVAGEQVHFLRVSNADSALCIGCHAK